MVTLRKKLERAKKIEMASSADEVLQEEIREYKVRGAGAWLYVSLLSSSVSVSTSQSFTGQ